MKTANATLQQDTHQFHVKWVTTAQPDIKTLFDSYALRYQEYKQWVAPPYDQLALDIDPFDELAKYHLGIFDDHGMLAACVRVLVHPAPFMLHYAFDQAFVNLPVQGPSIELSRAVIHPKYQNQALSKRFPGHQMLSLLMREVFRICKKEEIDLLYMATLEKAVRKGQRYGYPFQVLQTATMQNGDVVLVVSLSWAQLQKVQQQQNPDLANWFCA